MTKEELRQIYYLNKEIKMWRKELEDLKDKSLMMGQQITGMPRSASGKNDKVGDLAVTIMEIEENIEGKVLEIEKEKKILIEYIRGIDDSLIRQIVYLRNISCLTWKDIAVEIGGNNTAEGLRKCYDRYLLKG